MVIINIHEYTFSVNEFKEPTVLKGPKAVGTILARLLLLDPGTIQSHPDMGVGLVSRYRYTLDTDIDRLRDDYSRQIAKYLPQYQGVQVFTTLREKLLFVGVKIDDEVYNFLYDSENNDFKTIFRTLNDL